MKTCSLCSGDCRKDKLTGSIELFVDKLESKKIFPTGLDDYCCHAKKHYIVTMIRRLTIRNPSGYASQNQISIALSSLKILVVVVMVFSSKFHKCEMPGGILHLVDNARFTHHSSGVA